MLTGIGDWLRQQRQARGWSQREMARRLIRAGRACGDTAMPALDSMYRNVHRWEAGQTSPLERFQLYFCQAFGIPADQFGSAPLPAADSAAAPPPGPPAAPVRVLDDPGLLAARFRVEQEVAAAAHDGSDHAGQYDQQPAGTTLDQLHADLGRLARLGDTGDDPFAVFLELRRVRDRAARVAQRRLWPAEQAGLLVALGALNGLMGAVAVRLGYPDAAAELIRAGWVYAEAAGHGPLHGQLRAQLSALMYWRGSYADGRDLAADGLRYSSAGWPGAGLYLHQARSAARLGDADAARQAIRDAEAARDREHSDELVRLGGQFALSRATHHALAGAALGAIAGADAEAARELEQAIGLYEQGPGEGEHHWFAGKPLASLDLAVVRLRSGALDGAAAALGLVFPLPAGQRIAQVTTRLGAVRDELAAPIYRGAAQARELNAQIEEFSRLSLAG